jgi:PAS domain S-box-containing protein
MIPNPYAADAAPADVYKLFAQAPAPIAIYEGKEMRYVFLNDAYSKIFNHRKILGKTVREAFPELEGQPYFGILDEVFTTGVPFHATETPAQIDMSGDGIMTTRYYNLVYTPHRNDHGTIQGVMAFGHDVTEQVIARQKERQSDLRFRNIVEQSVDPILILKGEDMVLEVANEALFNVWNITRDYLGKTFLEILPEMKEQGFYELLQDVYRRGETHYGYESPATFRRANGERETVYFNFIYQPYREQDGQISGVLVMATNVTPLVRTKSKLKEIETNFRNLVMQAPIAIAVIRGDKFITEIANDAYLPLVSKTREELVGRPLFDVLPETRSLLEPIARELMRTGARYPATEFEITLDVNGQKKVSYFNSIWEPLKDEDGRTNGFMVVATDVTPQVLALRKIEEVVSQRTEELAKANTALQQKNGELEQFAYIASHDLQEPLRKVSTFTQMLEMSLGDIDDRSRGYLTKISTSASRMLQLIRDVLNFSQLAAHKEPFEAVALDSVVQHIIQDFELLIEQKAAQVHVGPLPTLQAIPLQMQQLFYNLISNGLKFSKPHTPPLVKIDARSLTEKEKIARELRAEEDYVLIKVEDNGIGFGSEYAEQIFNIFHRLHGKSEFAGTGIGLALCKKIATNHHGRIWATSQKELGATFHIILPLQQPLAD